jgi:hypothetical protein
VESLNSRYYQGVKAEGVSMLRQQLGPTVLCVRLSMMAQALDTWCERQGCLHPTPSTTKPKLQLTPYTDTPPWGESPRGGPWQHHGWFTVESPPPKLPTHLHFAVSPVPYPASEPKLCSLSLVGSGGIWNGQRRGGRRARTRMSALWRWECGLGATLAGLTGEAGCQRRPGCHVSGACTFHGPRVAFC